MNAENILALTPREIASLLTIDDCIIAVDQAFRLLGEEKAVPPVVLSIHLPGGGFHVKAGVLDLGRQYFAAKVNGNFPENPARYALPTIQGIVIVFDAEKGSPLAVMDSREITSLRTAAATAVAAKHLARRDSRTLTICGCGNQVRVQAIAISRICRLQTIFAYDKSAEQAERLARQLAERLGILVTAVSDLETTVRQSDICVTCTTSHKPLLGPDDASPGTFIAAVGADNPEKQELHPALMAKSKIVADILEQCASMGDLHHAIAAGVVTRANVHVDLSEIVAGVKPGRRGWISKEDYLEGLALAQLAPGPLAAQLAIYLGYIRAGVLGATAVGVAFVLPSFLMVLALSAANVRFGGLSWMQGMFYGIGAAVIGIIARSAFKLSKLTLGKDKLLWGIFAILAVSTAWTSHEIIRLFLLGGVVSVLVNAYPMRIQTRSVIPLLFTFGTFGLKGTLSGIFLYFAKAGMFVFGSGLAVVPFLYGGVVQGHHWLTDHQFVDAVAVAMITPGPVVITPLTNTGPKNPQLNAFVRGVTAAATRAIAEGGDCAWPAFNL